jgi:hypothetical protein
MTLILSMFYRDHIIQVSDRRLTDSKGRLFDDDSNKAVFFENRILIAYTGLSNTGGQKTDHWLAQTLAEIEAESDSTYVNPDWLFTKLADRATDAFQKISPAYGLNKAQKRHAFVALGWYKRNNSGQYDPIFYSISNAFTENFTWLVEAQDKFSVRRFPQQNTHYSAFLLQSGEQISIQRLNKLSRKIRECGNRGTSPEAVLTLLVNAVRNEAKTKRTIGQNLLIVSIPKNSINSPFFLTDISPTGNATMQDTASFRCMSPSRNTFQFSPICVSNASAYKIEGERHSETGTDYSIELTRLFPKP